MRGPGFGSCATNTCGTFISSGSNIGSNHVEPMSEQVGPPLVAHGGERVFEQVKQPFVDHDEVQTFGQVKPPLVGHDGHFVPQTYEHFVPPIEAHGDGHAASSWATGYK